VPLALAVGGARLLALGNEPDDRQQQPLVRRASVALAAASPDTSDDQRDARLALHSSRKRWRSRTCRVPGALIRATSNKARKAA
jgi:hypothetical protein